MLELQNICYSVTDPTGTTDILKNISLTIPDNRLVVFTGPNGGGKTTLAKAIMGRPPPAASSGTGRTSPNWASPSGPGWALATAFSSPPGSRASRSGIC